MPSICMKNPKGQLHLQLRRRQRGRGECDVLPQKEIVERYSSLSQWLAFKVLGIPYLVGKRHFRLLVHGPKWLSKRPL